MLLGIIIGYKINVTKNVFLSSHNILVVVCCQLLSNSFIRASLQQLFKCKGWNCKGNRNKSLHGTNTKQSQSPRDQNCIFTPWLLSFGFAVVALAVILAPAPCESQYRGQASHKLDATCWEIDKISTRIQYGEIISSKEHFRREGRIKTITTAKFHCQLFPSIAATRKLLLQESGSNSHLIIFARFVQCWVVPELWPQDIYYLLTLQDPTEFPQSEYLSQ